MFRLVGGTNVIGEDIVCPTGALKSTPDYEYNDVFGDSSVILENGLDKPFNGLNIYGRSMQTKYSGAQLLDPSKLEHENMDCEITDNGYIVKGIYVLDEDLSETNKRYIRMKWYIEPSFVAGKKVTFSYDDVISNNALETYLVTIRLKDAGGKYTYHQIDEGKSITLDIPADITGCVFRINVVEASAASAPAGTYNVEIHGAMACVGDKVLPWEPWTGGKPSPNPEYPQDIVSSGRKSRNILPYQLMRTGTDHGLTLEWLEDEQCFLLNGTTTDASRTYFNTTINLPGVKGSYYTASVIHLGGNVDIPDTNISYSLFYFGANDLENSRTNWFAVGLHNDNRVNIKILNYNYITFMWIYVTAGVTYTNYKFRVQLEEGSVATPWEPYTDNKLIDLKMTGKNLYPYGDVDNVVNEVGTDFIPWTCKKRLYIEALVSSTSKDAKSYIGVSYHDKNKRELGRNGSARPLDENDPIYSVWFDGTNANNGNDIDLRQVFYIRLRFRWYQNPVTDLSFKDIMVSDSPINNYEPYRTPQTMTIQIPNGLPGIPVKTGGNYTDETGQQWVTDEIDYKNGEYVQRVETYVATGDENWTQTINGVPNNTIRFDAYVNKLMPLNSNSISNYFSVGVNLQNVAWVAQGKSASASLGIRVAFPIESNITVETLKSLLKSWADTGKPMKYYYILYTPIRTPLSPEEIAAYKALRTYEGTTVITADSGEVPVGIKASYAKVSTYGKLEGNTLRVSGERAAGYKPILKESEPSGIDFMGYSDRSESIAKVYGSTRSTDKTTKKGV